MNERTSRRGFLKSAALGAAAFGAAAAAGAAEPPKIQGFEEGKAGKTAGKWKPVSDRKIRMGIVGYGACRFGSQFSLQSHPNVQLVAVSDLFPDRCQALAKVCKCEKTYASLEEMVKDDSIEAIFLATDAPSHCRHAIDVLGHGKHAASAVPAVFGSVEQADQLVEAVKKSGLNYMMFETSCYHGDVYAMRQIYRAGGFGKMLYSEGNTTTTPSRRSRRTRTGASGFRPSGTRPTPTPTTRASRAAASPRSRAWRCPASASACSRRTTGTRTPSGPRSR